MASCTEDRHADAVDGNGDDPVVTIDGVGVELAGRTILSSIDLSVTRGEFIALIGANGAGKTTLLRTILGEINPVSGTLSVAGHRRPRPGTIGYVPQKISIDPDLPLRARDLVALGLDGQRLGLPVRRRRFWTRVLAALDGVGAGDLADRPVGRLSGGQQQRVLIAAAIVSDPRLLLLDEPLANLDPANAQDIVRLLDALRRERGLAVIMSAHDVNPLLGVLDRVAYLADGRGVVGRTDEVVRTDVLTRLYRHPIEVARVAGRIIVMAGDTGHPHDDPTPPRAEERDAS